MRSPPLGFRLSRHDRRNTCHFIHFFEHEKTSDTQSVPQWNRIGPITCRGWLMHSQPVSVQHQQRDHTGTLARVLDTLRSSRLGARFPSNPSVRTAQWHTRGIWVATLPQRPPRPSLSQPGAPSFIEHSLPQVSPAISAGTLTATSQPVSEPVHSWLPQVSAAFHLGAVSWQMLPLILEQIQSSTTIQT